MALEIGLLLIALDFHSIDKEDINSSHANPANYGCKVIGGPYYGNVTIVDYKSMEDWRAGKPERTSVSPEISYLCAASPFPLGESS